MMNFTDDDFFDGEIKLRQPKKGYRAGSDALLLAAALPLMDGKMLEAGAGVAAPSICYLSRVKNAGMKPNITAVEMFGEIAEFARHNVNYTGFETQINILNLDIFGSAAEQLQQGLGLDSFDHIFSNPPFFNADNNRVSVNDYKAIAHTIKHDDLRRWLIFMVRLLKNKAEMTLIYPMEDLYKVLKILDSRIGDVRIRPIFSKQDSPATRFLLCGRKGSKSPLKMLPPIILRNHDGSVTDFADRIFRHGQGIEM